MSRARCIGILAVALAGGTVFLVAPAVAQDGQFASDRPEPTRPATFDGKRAMDYLEELCKIGPRQSGSDGMKKQQELLERHFKGHGAEIVRQTFKARQRSQKDPVEMVNLVARWHPDRLRRVILCAHYDTRPLADQESDPRKWRQPFVSANDGGSGVALLMELAHHIKDLKIEVGVDFVFFDGEEYYHKRDDEYFFGSRHFAADYRRARPKHTYTSAILLDMVGGKNARFPIEGNSWFLAAPLALEVWAVAEEFKCTAFQKREGPVVDDDHLALNRAGIPAIDIIDFSYPHWHRLTDVPANCSAASLEQVARVVSVWVQRAR